MARVLITGASGLLGANLVLAWRERHEVVAACHRHPIHLPGVPTLRADLSRPGEAERVVVEAAPDWVVHTAAATDVDACEADPEMAFRLNRDMAGAVAAAAAGAGARLAHISTDAVFDGQRGDYREEDEPRPINVYGRSKWEGERAVLAAHPQALVVRTNIYGWNAQSKRSLAEWFLANLEAGRTCGGFVDVWVTPILVNDLADLLARALEKGLQGVLHLAGGECVSKYEFGRRLAQIFGLDGDLIRPISVEEAGLRAPRPKRLCLDGDRARRQLGCPLPDMDEGLDRFRRLREAGYPESLKRLIQRRRS